MSYLVGGIGGLFTGIGLASGSQTLIICGAVYIGTAIILAGIKTIRR